MKIYLVVFGFFTIYVVSCRSQKVRQDVSNVTVNTPEEVKLNKNETVTESSELKNTQNGEEDDKNKDVLQKPVSGWNKLGNVSYVSETSEVITNRDKLEKRERKEVKKENVVNEKRPKPKNVQVERSEIKKEEKAMNVLGKPPPKKGSKIELHEAVQEEEQKAMVKEKEPKQEEVNTMAEKEEPKPEEVNTMTEQEQENTEAEKEEHEQEEKNTKVDKEELKTEEENAKVEKEPEKEKENIRAKEEESTAEGKAMVKEEPGPEEKKAMEEEEQPEQENKNMVKAIELEEKDMIEDENPEPEEKYTTLKKEEPELEEKNTKLEKELEREKENTTAEEEEFTAQGKTIVKVMIEEEEPQQEEENTTVEKELEQEKENTAAKEEPGPEEKKAMEEEEQPEQENKNMAKAMEPEEKAMVKAMIEEEELEPEDENTAEEEEDDSEQEEENTTAKKEESKPEKENTTPKKEESKPEEENTTPKKEKSKPEEKNTMTGEEHPEPEEEITMTGEEDLELEEEKTILEQEDPRPEEGVKENEELRTALGLAGNYNHDSVAYDGKKAMVEEEKIDPIVTVADPISEGQVTVLRGGRPIAYKELHDMIEEDRFDIENEKPGVFEPVLDAESKEKDMLEQLPKKEVKEPMKEVVFLEQEVPITYDELMKRPPVGLAGLDDNQYEEDAVGLFQEKENVPFMIGELLPVKEKEEKVAVVEEEKLPVLVDGIYQVKGGEKLPGKKGEKVPVKVAVFPVEEEQKTRVKEEEKVPEEDEEKTRGASSEADVNNTVVNNTEKEVKNTETTVKYIEPDVVPFIAQVVSNSSTCSASILDANWVITAARCISGIDKDDIKVHFGENIAESKIIIKAKKLVINPDYVHNGLEHDIGLIRLDQPVMLSSSIQGIDLYKQQWSPLGSIQCVAAGFRNGIAMKAKLFASRGREKCLCLNENNFICSYGNSIKQDHCLSDIGGPLVYKDKLIGIRHGNYLKSLCTSRAGIITEISEATDRNDAYTLPPRYTFPNRNLPARPTPRRGKRDMTGRDKVIKKKSRSGRKELKMKRIFDQEVQNRKGNSLMEMCNDTNSLNVYTYLNNYNDWIMDVMKSEIADTFKPNRESHEIPQKITEVRQRSKANNDQFNKDFLYALLLLQLVKFI